MPPKKSGGGGKKETEKVKKVVEDKTFGLKNKNKSSKVQKFVEEVKRQAVNSANTKKGREEQAPSKKQLAAERNAEYAEIFKPVIQQKIPFGTDPKTILCEAFRAGNCAKGNKCRFSHDLEVGRKSAKIDIYTDRRENAKADETMESWDQNKLESVILSKHGNPRTQTDIVCKFFLEAIEESKYGWFWTCPNGGDKCKYRHALPPGYVLKPKKTLADLRDAAAEEITLEDFLETERHKVGPTRTPITLETFTAWKQRRLEVAEGEAAKALRAKESAVKSGKRIGLSGRDLFTFNPELVHGFGDDNDGDDDMDLEGYLQENNNRDEEAERAAAAQAANMLGQSDPPLEDFDEQLFTNELENLQLELEDVQVNES